MTNKAGIALSGGVDSAVAAALLLENGYDVKGFYALQTPSPDIPFDSPAIQDLISPASNIADTLQIPLDIIDLRDEFHTHVLNYFIDSYKNGQTPNPCIICNRTLRWELFYNRVLQSGADFFATGHYARISSQPDIGFLLRGVDRTKDQSYFLSMVPKKHLQHTLFPVGEFTKEHVRKKAAEMNLPAADRSDSQDLCFIAHGDYREFIAEHILDSNIPGPIVNTKGELIGEHRGLAMFTVGQRKGIGISDPEPYYVTGKDPSQNILFVGKDKDRYRKTFKARDLALNIPPGMETENFNVRVRYRGPEIQAKIIRENNISWSVILDKPMPDITPGQACVFYSEEYCLGGGFIRL